MLIGLEEIKFRGKDVMTGEWTYGSHLKTGIGIHYIVPQNLTTNTLPQVKVDKSTVRQYIGIKDKLGKEIYIGQKVKWLNQKFNDCSLTELVSEDTIVGVVRWCRTVLILEDDDECAHYLPHYIHPEDMEILDVEEDYPEEIEIPDDEEEDSD